MYKRQLLSYPIRGQARRRIQILFQHPEVSFNPQLTLRQSLVEPFKLMGKPFDDGAILSVIEPFGLHAEHLARYPGELSGGELQRAALARVTVLEPEMILLDEPTSFLDLPNRYELCTLLRRLAHDHRKCILFSTHELDIALSLCDSIALIDPPVLRYLPTPDMACSGYIERLFSNSFVTFDTESGTIKVRK